jgi:hypothetical protein
MVGIPIPVDKYDQKATVALAKKLNQRRIPFAFIPLGGTQLKLAFDADRARRFKLLAMVNQDADFAATDLQALSALPVRRVNAAQLGGTELDELAPFTVAGEAMALSLYPRTSVGPEAQEQLVVHLIDEKRGKPASSAAGCSRRVGLRPVALGGREVEKIAWYSSGRPPVPLELTRNSTGVFATVPECVLWGVLAFTFRQ